MTTAITLDTIILTDAQVAIAHDAVMLDFGRNDFDLAYADEDVAMLKFTDSGGPLAIGLDERRVLTRVLTDAQLRADADPDADDSTRAAYAELLAKVSVERGDA